MSDMSEPSETGEAFDPEARRLCPDGACTGLIGDDGRCKECGRAAGVPSGEPAAKWRGEQDDDAADGSSGSTDGESGDGSSGSTDGDGAGGEASGDAADFADDARQLCSDGACTGLIGSDGKCKVCGLSAAS
jgi:hypothetical protein